MKKKITYLILIISIFMIESSVNALNIFGKTDEFRDVCGVSLSSSVPLFTSGIYNLIKILVPIILIIMGMIDFSKAVMAQDEKKMKDTTTVFIRRLIAAIFVFLILAIVQFIFNKVSGNNGFSSCMNCVLSNDCAVSTENYKSDSSKYNNYKNRTLALPVKNDVNKVCEAITKKKKCEANNLCIWEKKENDDKKKCYAKGISLLSTSKTTTNEDSATTEQTNIVNYAKKYAMANPNHPYVYGGTSLCKSTPYKISKGCKVDCSGFVQQVYVHNGYKCMNNARTTDAQANYLGAKTYTKNTKLKSGDLLFYTGSCGMKYCHVTMYIGNDQVVHASTSRTGVIISPMSYKRPSAYASVIGNSKCKKS